MPMGASHSLSGSSGHLTMYRSVANELDEFSVAIVVDTPVPSRVRDTKVNLDADHFWWADEGDNGAFAPVALDLHGHAIHPSFRSWANHPGISPGSNSRYFPQPRQRDMMPESGRMFFT